MDIVEDDLEIVWTVLDSDKSGAISCPGFTMRIKSILCISSQLGRCGSQTALGQSPPTLTEVCPNFYPLSKPHKQGRSMSNPNSSKDLLAAPSL